jgi:hypothetical protein
MAMPVVLVMLFTVSKLVMVMLYMVMQPVPVMQFTVIITVLEELYMDIRLVTDMPFMVLHGELVQQSEGIMAEQVMVL